MESSVMRRLLAVCVAVVMVSFLPRSLDAIMEYAPTDSVPVYRLFINGTKYI
jgi:hypothetical protein